jgi:hypothetical protein
MPNRGFVRFVGYRTRALRYGTLAELLPKPQFCLLFTHLPLMPTRRLDDRIRELCDKAGAAANSPHPDDGHLESILQQLLSAIHEKVERIRALAARKLLQPTEAEGTPQKDRRAG